MSDPNNTGNVIQVDGVKRYYETGGGTVKALDDASITVERGEFLAIAGPSGSGKSTMLNIMGGLDVPDSGSVEVDGKSLAGMTQKDLAALRRDHIGFIFQAYNLNPVLTVLENTEYVMMLQGRPVSERTKLAIDVLKAVGLGDKLDRRPNELSGGQQQRVAVARAIAGSPAIVLADEPTANLDSTTGQELLDMMQRLNKERGVTFVFSTHDPEVMKRASRLIRLRDGQIESEERRA